MVNFAGEDDAVESGPDFERLRDDLSRLTAPRLPDVVELEPLPGLRFRSPADGVEISPATGGGADAMKAMETLDLRVLAAHLSTALDNVTSELKLRRGV